MGLTREHKKILQEAEKNTGCTYDFNISDLWNIIDDLNFEINEMKNDIKGYKQKIHNLENPPLEDFDDPRYEYGY